VFQDAQFLIGHTFLAAGAGAGKTIMAGLLIRDLRDNAEGQPQ
jgi:hypothetical protein